MKFCDKECFPICDFCKFFDFNGDENGTYINLGCCNFHKENRDPTSQCDEFICMNIKEENKNE